MWSFLDGEHSLHEPAGSFERFADNTKEDPAMMTLSIAFTVLAVGAFSTSGAPAVGRNDAPLTVARALVTEYSGYRGSTLALGKDDYLQIEEIIFGVNSDFEFYYPYVRGIRADGSPVLVDDRQNAQHLFADGAHLGGFYFQGPTGQRDWIENIQLGVNARGQLAVLGMMGITPAGTRFNSLQPLDGEVLPCIRIPGWLCVNGPQCPAGSHTCVGAPPDCNCSSGGGHCKKIGTWSCPDKHDCGGSDDCVLHVVNGEFQCDCN